MLTNWYLRLRYPSQDSIPIPDPGSITEDDVADTGVDVMFWIAKFPIVVVAIIAALIIRKLLQNNMVKLIAAVLVTGFLMYWLFV